MAVVIHKPGKTTEYVLRADRASAAATVFDIRPLTWEEKEQIEDLAPMTQEQAIQIAAIMTAANSDGREPNETELARMNEVMPIDRAYMRKLLRQCVRAVRFGLVRIRGMIDDDGNAIELSPEDFARQAPKGLLLELGSEILRNSKGDEGFIKN